MEGFKSKIEKVVAAGIIATGLASSPEAHAENSRTLDQYEKITVMQNAQKALDSTMTENSDGTYSMISGDVEVVVKIHKHTVYVHADKVTVEVKPEPQTTIEIKKEKVEVGAPKL